MRRSSILGLMAMSLVACDGAEEKRAPTKTDRQGLPPVEGVAAPDWDGPNVKLTVEPPIARLPGAAEVTFELPSAGWRLQQQQSRIEGDRFALRFRLMAPVPGESGELTPTQRAERVPVPPGSVRVEVWVELTEQGDVFEDYVLAVTALRQVGR